MTLAHATGLVKHHAEDWLDWMENNGQPSYHVLYPSGHGLAVLYEAATIFRTPKPEDCDAKVSGDGRGRVHRLSPG
jgi:hypothetical protein